jgi:hypothetical protein
MPRVALLLAAALLTGALAATAEGVTTRGRTRIEHAPIVALSVTGRSVTYAVGDNASKTDCAHVYLWRTAGGPTGKWRYGKPTEEPCIEGLSTGSGISAVAMSAERSLWIQYAGGNLRDWQLYTATRTTTKPRQLAFVEQDVELPSPIVVGQGTLAAVPYAVKQTVTYLGDDGAAVFKWTAPASVRLLAAGHGPGGAQVAAVLDSGVVDLLSGSGKVVRSYTYSPGAVTAVSLAPAGLVVQTGTTIAIRNGARITTLALPKGAKMFGYGEGRVYYSLTGSLHARKVSSGVDSPLVAPRLGRSAIGSFATAGGFAWAIGNQISWSCAACVDY